MNFPCIRCGLCCRKINVVVEAGIKFPYKYNKDGKCEMLGDDNLCLVYDSRPLICNIEKMALNEKMGKINYYNKNIDGCNLLLLEDGRTERLSHLKI